MNQVKKILLQLAATIAATFVLFFSIAPTVALAATYEPTSEISPLVQQTWWINGSGSTPFRWAVGMPADQSLAAGTAVVPTGQRSGAYTLVSAAGRGTGWVLTSRISTNCNAQGLCFFNASLEDGSLED